MLVFHYRRPEKTVHPKSMAIAMGWKDPAAAHARYGRLGRLVGERLHLPPQFKVEALAHFRYPGPERQCQWKMRERVAVALERLGWVKAGDASSRDSDSGESPKSTKLFEGAIHRVAVNAYERNPEARRRCLAHYGASCVICGFDFGVVYGSTGEGFIHVHHLRMMKKGKKKRAVDPVKDLKPVCPNCHSVIHLNPRPYSVEEVKAMVSAQRGLRKGSETGYVGAGVKEQHFGRFDEQHLA
jgi:putative restriction endonuclease